MGVGSGGCTCEYCLLHASDFDAFIHNCFDQEGIMSYNTFLFLFLLQHILLFLFLPELDWLNNKSFQTGDALSLHSRFIEKTTEKPRYEMFLLHIVTNTKLFYFYSASFAYDTIVKCLSKFYFYTLHDFLQKKKLNKILI